HRATWIGWPHNPDDWPGKFDCIAWVYGEIVRRLGRSERVCIVALPEVEASGRRGVGEAGRGHLGGEVPAGPPGQRWPGGLGRLGARLGGGERQAAGRAGGAGLEVQRLGEVRQLARRRRGGRADGGTARTAPRAADEGRSAGGPGGGRDRRKW